MNYRGIIIEESLADRSVLDYVNITKTVIEIVTEKHKTPWVKKWTMHEVEIQRDKAAEIANKISVALDQQHNWYADYKTELDHYIIYSNKVFHVADRNDQTQYDEATNYGISIGIPEYQVDFSPYLTKWKR